MTLRLLPSLAMVLAVQGILLIVEDRFFEGVAFVVLGVSLTFVGEFLLNLLESNGSNSLDGSERVCRHVMG